jgi:predicted DNA-binding transcriptional regulator AlpA
MEYQTMQNTIPETGFVRLPVILKVIPVGRTTWWAGVKSGRFPKPVKLGSRITAWRVEDIRALIEQPGNSTFWKKGVSHGA